MTRTNNKHCSNGPKKTTIGQGKFSKWGNRGGGPSGSTPSKNYRKKPRGQGWYFYYPSLKKALDILSTIYYNVSR